MKIKYIILTEREDERSSSSAGILPSTSIKIVLFSQCAKLFSKSDAVDLGIQGNFSLRHLVNMQNVLMECYITKEFGKETWASKLRTPW